MKIVLSSRSSCSPLLYRAPPSPHRPPPPPPPPPPRRKPRTTACSRSFTPATKQIFNATHVRHRARRSALCDPNRRLVFRRGQAERDYQAAKREVAQARAWDRHGLDATDNIALDVFIAQRDLDMRGNAPALRVLNDVRPMNHFYGFHTSYADFASGQGGAPFKTLVDYEANIARHKQFAGQIDMAIARFREGMKTGVVQPKLVVRNMIDQLDLILKDGPDGSAFMGPLKSFPGRNWRHRSGAYHRRDEGGCRERHLSRLRPAARFPAQRLPARRRATASACRACPVATSSTLIRSRPTRRCR